MPQVFLHGVTVNLTVCLLFCLNSCKNPHFEPLPKIQIYVHCDVVICDARNPLGGVCAGQCSQQAQGTKGKTLKILYYLTLNNHFGCFFFFKYILVCFKCRCSGKDNILLYYLFGRSKTSCSRRTGFCKRTQNDCFIRTPDDCYNLKILIKYF